MKILRIARRCAYHAGISAMLMLAMGTSHADDCEAVVLVANDDPSLNDPDGVSGESIHIDVLGNDQPGDGSCFGTWK